MLSVSPHSDFQEAALKRSSNNKSLSENNWPMLLNTKTPHATVPACERQVISSVCPAQDFSLLNKVNSSTSHSRRRVIYISTMLNLKVATLHSSYIFSSLHTNMPVCREIFTINVPVCRVMRTINMPVCREMPVCRVMRTINMPVCREMPVCRVMRTINMPVCREMLWVMRAQYSLINPNQNVVFERHCDNQTRQ